MEAYIWPDSNQKCTFFFLFATFSEPPRRYKFKRFISFGEAACRRDRHVMPSVSSVCTEFVSAIRITGFLDFFHRPVF
jgi:hypothetical protein